MKNSIFTIIKKELARFFGDRRMVFTTILLPGLLIYFLYTFMGDAIGNMYTVDEDYTPSISVVNLPDSIKSVAESAQITLTPVQPEEVNATKEKISAKEHDLCIIFPESFDALVTAYDSSSGGEAPNVEIYYNAASTKSQSAYTTMLSLLDNYEAVLSNKFDVNRGDTVYDLASEKDTAGSIFASMLPMLLMIFLFSGCMAVAPESIAGEKERGTIATLLITPMKRSSLAIGKISALAVIALLSGISSAAGTILSLPKLMGAAADQLNANVYAIQDYLLLGVVILSTVLLMITLISMISAAAKTIKEAQTAVTPLMIVVMLIGVTAMFGGGAQESPLYYLIPFYNSVQCMVGIFSFEWNPVCILISVISNLAYTGIGVYLLTKMFNSERIIFSKS